MAGHEGSDELYGGAGHDALEGGSGADVLEGDSGDDEIYGDGGADVFVFKSGHGDDTIHDFTSGGDRIDLTAFFGIQDIDDLHITYGDDGTTIDLTEHGGGTIFLDGVTRDGLDAQDFIFHNGWVYGTSGGDTITGNAGNDLYDGLGGEDFIYGRGGNDHLRGGAEDDALYGGADSDTLRGEAGDDELDGGTGDDTLWGGPGQDKFVFQSGHGSDTIKDFTDGEDLIDLTALTGITSFGDLTITADGNDAVINLASHGGGTIRLENFEVGDLDASDFDFCVPPVDPGVEGG